MTIQEIWKHNVTRYHKISQDITSTIQVQTGEHLVTGKTVQCQALWNSVEKHDAAREHASDENGHVLSFVMP